MARLTRLRGNGQDQGKVSGPQCVLFHGIKPGWVEPQKVPVGMAFGGININS